MSNKNFAEQLRTLQQGLQEERLSAGGEARLRRLLQGQRPRRRPFALILAPVAAAAMVLLVWAVWPRGTQEAVPARPTVGGFELLAGAPTPSSQGRVRCGSAGCSLRAARLGTTLELNRGAEVGHGEMQLRVFQGEATLQVRPVPAGAPPVKVRVSHGVIVVLGTRFTVWQEQAGGRVVLHEGVIQFNGDGGRVVRLKAGQELRWPQQPAAAPPPAREPAPAAAPAPAPPRLAPPAPVRVRKKPPTPALSPAAAVSLLDRVERLRLQSRYSEAVRLLGKALPRVTDKVLRERLSYEKGTILSDHLLDREAACRHWRRHLRVHGRARYGAQIDVARARLDCAAATK